MGELSSRRILLIGGAGFIGHHLALAFKELDAELLIVDSLNVNNYYNFKKQKGIEPNADLYLGLIERRLELLKKNGISLTELDARDYHELCRVINMFSPDTIIHLAAVAHAGKSNKDPYSTFDHSLRTLENALDGSRDSSVKHFVYFSSSMIYGNFKTETVTEDTLCEPLGIYGALKFAGEKMVIAYNQVFNLPFTIVRPSALYGPRCVSRRVGQIFIENAMNGSTISVNGDGSDRLDFTYIKDLVSGVLKVLTNENAKGEIFNITFGQSRSIAEMANILMEHFPGVKIKYLPKDDLIPSRGTLSIEKAKKFLDYQPQFPLEKGFSEYINWYKEMIK
jgi:nucleoside-diphosphate-sugar epimerase